MKNTKTLIILCLIIFLTAIGCSDYMEFAEREYQAEREYRATEDAMDENYEEESFLVFPENEQGYSPMEEKEYSETIERDLEKSTKENENPEKTRDSYWKRLEKFKQNN
jgi:hypothetical protein